MFSILLFHIMMISNFYLFKNDKVVIRRIFKISIINQTVDIL